MNKYICINTKCVHANECVRLHAYLQGKCKEEVISVINPSLLAEGHGCPHLARRQKVFYARGFQAIFEELPRKKIKEINQALSLLFGRNPYYKMRRGDRLITPKAQAKIRSAFILLGIATEDTNLFDKMVEREEWVGGQE